MVATITPSALSDLRRRGERISLIDVRTPAEFGEVHVEFAHNVPLDRLDPKEVVGRTGQGPIYFVCKSGGRSQKACERMLQAGFSDVVSVEGGTAACEAAGIPVVRGRKAMSLERQSGSGPNAASAAPVATSAPAQIRSGSGSAWGSPASSAAASCSPASPTPAAWRC